MAVYLAHDTLRTWTGPKTWKEARQIFARGGVRDLVLEDPVRATVTTGGRDVFTRFRVLHDGSVESQCPCRRNQEYGVICAHVVAAGMALADRTEDPVRERRRRIKARIGATRHHPHPQRWKAGTPDTIPAELCLRVPGHWKEALRGGFITLTCYLVIDGKRKRIDRIPASHRLAFTHQHIHLLYVLEDMTHCESCPAIITLTVDQFIELLDEIAPGKLSVAGSPEPLSVTIGAELSTLTASLESNSGELVLSHATESDADVVAAGRHRAWAQSECRLFPLSAVLPADLRRAYTEPVHVPRTKLFDMLRRRLPKLEDDFLVDYQVDEGDFRIERKQPAFEVVVSGGSDRLRLTLTARYDESRVAVSTPPRANSMFPSGDSPTLYWERNLQAEREAEQWLKNQFSVDGERMGCITVSGADDTVSALADGIPCIRTHGWRVRFDGDIAAIDDRTEWVRPRVEITSIKDTDQMFRIDLSYRDALNGPVETQAVESALHHKQSCISSGGRALLLNPVMLNGLQTAIAECSTNHRGVEYVPAIHAGFLTGYISTLDAAELIADEPWLAHANAQRRQSRLQQVDLGEPLNTRLRPYQRDGVDWLRFCERNGYSGILADEMGLGKTIQALAWIQLTRCQASIRALPTLVVCPTSLVHNWDREASRFVPHLTRHIISGPERHRHWARIADADIVFTSYALLRRDIDRYAEIEFAIAVLDEAQHIKNRSTQNAIAAKSICSRHRLVLTGTPIENSVNDLWSIMDFLQPGYLGSHGHFKACFERPIAAGGRSAVRSLQRLRQKIEPFMLRRLKQNVARDLPPKVTRIATCRMATQQQRLYNRLLSEYHDHLAELVGSSGFDRARFSVFSALLRLRQVCCHPSLLKDPHIDSGVRSAKVDLFFELLNEAMDGGHRVLVFSQFVSMLHILRDALDERDISYCYLDGNTRHRLDVVDRFNTDDSIPVFLVSLKAGGSGLNLTGADIVIHFDPWWNPAVEDQATDRTHRIGQTRTVYSIKLITEGTIEEKVLDLQSRKRTVIDATLETAQSLEKALTWDDIQELLSMNPKGTT